MADNDDFLREFQAEDQMAKKNRRRFAIGGSILLIVGLPIVSAMVVGAFVGSEPIQRLSDQGDGVKTYQYSYLEKECRTGLENHQNHLEEIIIASRQADLLLQHPLYNQVPENLTLHSDVISHNDEAVRQGKESIGLLKGCVAKVKDKWNFTHDEVLKIKDTVVTLPNYRGIDFDETPESVATSLDLFRSSFNLDDFIASDSFDYSSLSWTDDYAGFEYEGLDYDYGIDTSTSSSHVRQCDEVLRAQYTADYDAKTRELGLRHDREMRAASEAYNPGMGGIGAERIQDINRKHRSESDVLLREYERKLRAINC